jgi:hypothetical protein
MLVRFMSVVLIAALASACSKPVQVEAPKSKEERYRPSWTLNLMVHLDGARACLEGREEPRFVAHVEPLATGATGYSTVDAFGEVQNCAYSDGKVLRREAAAVRAADLVGLPLFAVGPQQPVLPVGVKAEEVLDDDRVIGWLFWPDTPSASSEGGEEAP